MVSRLPWEQDTTEFDSRTLDCQREPDRGAAHPTRGSTTHAQQITNVLVEQPGVLVTPSR